MITWRTYTPNMGAALNVGMEREEDGLVISTPGVCRMIQLILRKNGPPIGFLTGLKIETLKQSK